MKRSVIRIAATVGVVGSAVFHLIVMWQEWYLTVDGIDKIQHFAGGAVVAVFLLYWAMERYPHLLQGPWYVQWGVVLGLVMLIGVGWEVFEYTFDNYWGPLIAPGAAPAQPSIHDTMRDLLADGGGGIVGLMLFWRRSESKDV